MSRPAAAEAEAEVREAFDERFGQPAREVRAGDGELVDARRHLPAAVAWARRHPGALPAADLAQLADEAATVEQRAGKWLRSLCPVGGDDERTASWLKPALRCGPSGDMAADFGRLADSLADGRAGRADGCLPQLYGAHDGTLPCPALEGARRLLAFDEEAEIVCGDARDARGAAGRGPTSDGYGPMSNPALFPPVATVREVFGDREFALSHGADLAGAWEEEDLRREESGRRPRHARSHRGGAKVSDAPPDPDLDNWLAAKLIYADLARAIDYPDGNGSLSAEWNAACTRLAEHLVAGDYDPARAYRAFAGMAAGMAPAMRSQAAKGADVAAKRCAQAAMRLMIASQWRIVRIASEKGRTVAAKTRRDPLAGRMETLAAGAPELRGGR